MLFLANLMAGIGSFLAATSSVGCVFFAWDEPTTPKELLK